MIHRYKLVSDNSGHRYVIPVEKATEWDRFLELPEDDPASWNVPSWATLVGGTLDFHGSADVKEAVQVFAIKSSSGKFFSHPRSEWPTGLLCDAVLFPSRFSADETLKLTSLEHLRSFTASGKQESSFCIVELELREL